MIYRFLYIFDKIKPNDITIKKEYQIKSNNNYINENIKKDKNIDLSIIIPVYNAEAYVTTCVNSIINNNWKYSYEIILINDGSTDDTQNILNQFKDIKNIHIFYQENSGAATARNYGISKAKGKFLMFVDSDDSIDVKGTEKMIDKAIEEKCDLVQGSYVKIGKSEENVIFNNETLSMEKEERKVLKIPGFPWGKIIKSEIFKNVYFPNNLLYEDTIMPYIIYERCKKIGTIKDIVYKYTINNNGVTIKSRKTRKSEDTVKVINYVLDKMKELNIEFTYELYRFTIECQLSYITYNRIKGNKKKIQKKIFYEACNIVRKLEKSLMKNEDIILKNIERSLKRQNFVLWKYSSEVLNLIR